MLNTLRSGEKTFGITEYKGKIILNDENYHIHEKIIKKLDTSKILQIELSSTVDSQHFSYWENGVLLRKKTMGKNNWMDEEQLLILKDEMPKDEYEKLTKGDDDFGGYQSKVGNSCHLMP